MIFELKRVPACIPERQPPEGHPSLPFSMSMSSFLPQRSRGPVLPPETPHWRLPCRKMRVNRHRRLYISAFNLFLPQESGLIIKFYFLLTETSAHGHWPSHSRQSSLLYPPPRSVSAFRSVIMLSSNCFKTRVLHVSGTV